MLVYIVVKVISVFIEVSLLRMFSGNSVVSSVMLMLVIIVLMCGVWYFGWILVNIGGSRLLWFMIMKMCGWLMIIISIIEDRLISVLILII